MQVRERILVLGAGVVGLTTALVLRRRGFEVRVLADRFAPNITSVVAGALWEWPPAVCGHRHNLDRSKRWAETSYRIYSELASDPATGAFVRPVTFYFKRRLEDDPFQHNKMVELAARVRGFRRDAALIAEHGIGPRQELGDAYQHLAPMIDTDVYLRWLLASVKEAGCTIEARTIPAPLADQEADLLEEFHAATIVNCTGLGARELGDPTVYPLRGALIRIRNDGRTMPRIAQAHCVSHDGVCRDPGFVFIVPRGDDKLIIGGLAEPHESSLEIGLKNYEPIREMFRRCVEFLPILKNAEIDAAEPVRVGLRPSREHGVRLEWEGDRTLHNYGHGGSGVTYSWGCAQDVAELIEQRLEP